MTILRKHQKSNFTTIQNAVLEDDRLSYRARGVAAYLLTKPDGWYISIAVLAKSPDVEGEAAINTAMRELAVYGYMMRRREQGEGGSIATITIIADYPAFLDIGTPEERIQGYANKTDPPIPVGLVDGGSLVVNTDQQDTISSKKEEIVKIAKVKLPKQRVRKQRKPIQLGQESFGIDDVDTEEMEKKTPEHKEMFGLLGTILGWDTKLPKIRGRLGMEVKALRAAGYTVKDLETFRDKIWPNYWVYKKEGRRPYITEVQTLLGPLKVKPVQRKTVWRVYSLDNNGMYPDDNTLYFMEEWADEVEKGQPTYSTEQVEKWIAHVKEEGRPVKIERKDNGIDQSTGL